MKKLILTALLIPFLFAAAFAQTLPLVYDVENTGKDAPLPYLGSFEELPTITAFPDPFKWADGRGRISNFSDWTYRRAEIGAQIQNYEIGTKPPRPDTITASYSSGELTVIVTVNGRTLTLTSQVNLPAGSGPFPAVIGMNSPSGSIPDTVFANRNIASIAFYHNQVTSYGDPQNSDPYYRLYPDLNLDNTGQYSAWAWGVSRIIDGLELVQDSLPIDLKHIAVTGCSYAGKMALFSGAFDERIALTIAQESGGGGATSWRYSQSEPDGTVEKINNTNYNWFRNSMNQFSSGNVARLPEDHHELMAMVAPRALYVTANPDYEWLSNPSCYSASVACQQVYEALGISDRFGFSIVGGHGHCAVPGVQFPEIDAFVDKFLLGKDSVNTANISTNPYNINLSNWINWTNPILSNGTSYFGITSLIEPANLQAELDTSITFKWNKVADAENYIFQLSENSTFTNIIQTDTTADTLKAVDGLLKGKKYFWRVEVESADGLGPWSSVWNFTTFISLPSDSPELVSVTLPYSNRADYATYAWEKVEFATGYLIQVSKYENFSSFLNSASTSDTFRTFQGTSEGEKYFWRVQANNIAGSGPWSDTFEFIPLLAPTDLDLELSGADDVTLKWKDNSKVEDGYIIERKEDPQASFEFLDTLKGSAKEYIDESVETSKTYIYRIKAYKDSAASAYSNEASLTLTDIKQEKKIPTEYSLSQNYPNPFNPSTRIKFGLPAAVLTKIIIYNSLGREIQTLINKELSAGFHQIDFNAENLPSGVYFYRIQAGNFIRTQKMILMK